MMENLPNELLLHIFQYIIDDGIPEIDIFGSGAKYPLNWQNINSLRATCRQFKKKIEDIFAETGILLIYGSNDDIGFYYHNTLSPISDIEAYEKWNRVEVDFWLCFCFGNKNTILKKYDEKYYDINYIGPSWLFKIAYANGIEYYKPGHHKNYNLYLDYCIKFCDDRQYLAKFAKKRIKKDAHKNQERYKTKYV